MRDNTWLENQMYQLWEEHFADVPRKNIVMIKFGKRSKRQLGCIKWIKKPTKSMNAFIQTQPKADDPRVSLINITGYFKDTTILDAVVLGTIAHEMCHYAHGFHSPLQQLYKHPHKGGVIRKEMYARGLKDIYQTAKRWLKENWKDYLIRQK